MRYYLVTKDGVTFERDLTKIQLKDALATGRYKLANNQQRRDFLKARKEEELRYLQDNNYINIYYKAPTHNPDGYGNSARQFKERAKKHGIYFNEVLADQKIGLCYSIANEIQFLGTPIKLGFTMFESTKFPDFWEPYLRSADHVIVPTTFCHDVLFDNFQIDATVIPLGIETDNFGFIERHRNDSHPFTFLHYDAFKFRKGWDIVFQAFNEEFGEELGKGDDVRLIFKTTVEPTPPMTEYPKIKKYRGRLPQSQLMEILHEADCFVFPTRGEGFGLTPLEALASGMPAIVPNHTGISTYWHPDYCYDLEWKQVKAIYENIELRGMELGIQWEPTVASTRKAMRLAYNEWKTKTGKYAFGNNYKMATYARKFDIEESTKKLCDLIKSYL